MAGARSLLSLAVSGLALAGSLTIARAQEASRTGAAPAGTTEVQVTRRPYDKTQLLAAEAAVQPSVYRGRAIWQQRCAYCHDGVGQPSYHTMGPWLGPETLTQYGEEGVRGFVAQGTENMPGFQYTLRPEQVNDLVAFIKTIGPDQKPTALQLNGGSPIAAGTND